MWQALFHLVSYMSFCAVQNALRDKLLLDHSVLAAFLTGLRMYLEDPTKVCTSCLHRNAYKLPALACKGPELACRIHLMDDFMSDFSRACWIAADFVMPKCCMVTQERL